MLNTPFSPWPSYTPMEAQRISELLLSNKVNYWTGDECRHFEQEFAAWTGTRHAVAVANGTVALDLAFKALGIGQGDEVIVTPRTFLASASSIVNAGAVPVFVDVDRDTQNITAETISAFLTARTRAVVCVHLAGLPCDMDPIMSLAYKHNLYVIEDCAQAHGARYKGRMVGSIGDVGAWSFCQDKIMTTGGEGGMVTTNDTALWSTMWSFKDHGKSWEAVYERSHPPGFRWLHDSFGTNWRMLELQAALGRMQLQRMPEMTARRQSNAQRLADACRRHAVVRVPDVPAGMTHAWYRFYAFINPERLDKDWSRDRIVNEILARGVPCYHGTCPEVYLERAFEGTGFRPKQRLPVARELGDTSLMFLVHPTLTDAEMDKTCMVLDQVLATALKGTLSSGVLRRSKTDRRLPLLPERRPAERGVHDCQPAARDGGRSS